MSAKISQRDFFEVRNQRLRQVTREIQALRASLSEDAVHDARVSIRRFLEIARVFDNCADSSTYGICKRELKELFDELGKIRDLDVQMGRVLGLPSPLKAEQRYLRFLRKTRRKNGLRVAQLLKERWPVLIKTLHLWRRQHARLREETLLHAFRRLLRIRYEKWAHLRKLAMRGFAKNLHALRIATKKYRYLYEVGVDLNLATESALIGLRAEQDALGEMHDFKIYLKNVKKFDQTA